MLEDEFGDIISKARFGLGYRPEYVTNETRIPPERLESFERYRSLPTQVESNLLADLLHLHPAALWGIACEQFQPEPPRLTDIILTSCQVTKMLANAYFIQSKGTRHTLLVDPGDDVPALIDMIDNARVRLCGVLVTHGHRDHAGGLQAIVSAYNVPILGHPAECHLQGQINLFDTNLDNTIEIDGYVIKVLLCPGHTSYSCVFAVQGVLFTGDTLFAGSMGRAASRDYYPQLLESGRRLTNLPDTTPVFPGHGPATTIGQEKKHNPFLANITGCSASP